MWKRPTLKQSLAIGATLAVAAATATPAIAKGPGGGPKHGGPTVVIKTPAAGSATAASAVSVAGTASTTTNATSITQVAVEVDANGWKQATGTSSWNLSLDTSKLAN